MLTGASSLAAAACFLIFCLVSACFAAADVVPASAGFVSALRACSVTACFAVPAPRFFAAASASSVLFRKVVGTANAPNSLLT